MSEIEVLVPVAATRNAAHPLATRPASLAGARIGLLDNCKSNADGLLDGLFRGLASIIGGEPKVVVERKDATAAAPAAVMAHLERCDAVVLAIAD